MQPPIYYWELKNLGLCTYFGGRPVRPLFGSTMPKGFPPSRKLAPAGQAPSDAVPGRLGTPPSRLPDHPEPADEALALESAQYIAQMSAELASIARASNLDLLAYFLDMARVEATSSIRKLEGRAD